MRKRLLGPATAAVTLGVCILSGCASNAMLGDAAIPTTPGAMNSPAVEDKVRVSTAEIMPESPGPELPIVEGVDAAVTVSSISEEDIMAMYHIGPTDVLEFRSFDDESLNTAVVVRHDGMISLPWIPDLKVAGHTRDEATDIVQEAYQQLYYEAEVSLQITQAASKTYTVMGDVNRAAEFPYTKPVSLLNAIISAGGLRVNQRGGDSFVGGQGQLVKAYIVRGTGEERTASVYDLRNIEKSGSHESQTLVLPGDTVFIPVGLNLVYVLGAVGRPGIQPLSEGMTLLQLLASVNGFNEQIARMKQVVLMRQVNDEQTEVQLLDVKTMLRTGTDFLIQPGDIIYVPQKRLVNLAGFINRSLGVVTPILGVTSQVMGLYTQAFDAYYASDRADLLYNSDTSNQLQTNLQLLEAVRQIGTSAGVVTGTN